MTTWTDFANSAPELAARGLTRMNARELIVLGSLKKDGAPRVSPVEPDIVDGELMMGMIWQSNKALDLLRDPRCMVTTVVSDREATEGEFKIVGRAVPVEDPHKRNRYCEVIEERIQWRPEGDFHLFAIDIDRVWEIEFADEKMTTTRWPE